MRLCKALICDLNHIIYVYEESTEKSTSHINSPIVLHRVFLFDLNSFLYNNCSRRLKFILKKNMGRKR